MATWTPKPPHGARIDRSRPLAQGLVSWYPLLSGAGLPLNVISGVPATANTAPWSRSAYGPSLACASSPSSVYATVTNDLALNLTGPLTLICACAPTVGTNQAVADTANNNAGAATVGYTWFFGHSSTTDTSILLANGSTRTIVASNDGAIDGNPHVYAVTWDGATVSFYRDGIPWGSGAYASTLASAGAGGKWLGAGYLGSPPLQGPLYWLGAYNRVLSTQEIQATGANPLAIYGLLYRQPESRVLLLSTPAVTPLFRRTLYDRAGSRGVA